MPLKRKHANALVLTAAHDIAAAARTVRRIAQDAEARAKAGKHTQALQILLDVEPPLHDARKLLDLASLAHRNVKDGPSR